MSEPITNLADAVAAQGALPVPVPVGPEPQASERDRLRVAFIAALETAHETHPCPVTGRPYWLVCVHYDEAGRMSGVGSCHSERRADAVLAVRDAEVEFLISEADRLAARVAELLAERHVTNEALDDAVRALRADRDGGLCADCGHVESAHAVDAERPCDASGGRVRSCTCAWFIPREGLRAPSADVSADKLTRTFAPSQALREDAPGEEAVRHSVDAQFPKVAEFLRETGGAS